MTSTLLSNYNPALQYDYTSKRLNQEAAYIGNTNQLDILRGKPFTVWNAAHLIENVNCNRCFNCILGKPTKDGHPMPLLPYQQKIHNAIESGYKYLWIKKSRGLGVTEFFLRYFLYCAINQKWPKHSEALIIVGPRERLARDLISRMKRILERRVAPNYFDKSNSSSAIINDVTFSALPSHHTEAGRSKDFIKGVLIDEGDYFTISQQSQVRSVIESLIAKANSNPDIYLVSTPSSPIGLMSQVENEHPSIYHKLSFTYRDGIQYDDGAALPYPIYSEEELKIASAFGFVPDLDFVSIFLFLFLLLEPINLIDWNILN